MHRVPTRRTLGRFGWSCLIGTLALAPPTLATNVCDDITTDTTWTPAGSPYILTCFVTLSPGATLTVASGVQVQFAGSELHVYGRLNATGASFTGRGGLGSLDIVIYSPGQANLTNCTFVNACGVAYYAGSSGTVSGCTGLGALVLNSTGVCVGAGMQCGILSLGAPVTVSHATVGSNVDLWAPAALEDSSLSNATFNPGSSGATLTGNIFTSTCPIVVWDANVSLSYVTGNTYPADSSICINTGNSVTLNSANTWGVVDGLRRYYLNGILTVLAGATLTIAPSIEVRNANMGGGIHVYGALNATGVSLTADHSSGSNLHVFSGGNASLTSCDFAAIWTVVYDAGSSGTVSGWTGGNADLKIHSTGVSLNGGGMQLWMLWLYVEATVSNIASADRVLLFAPATIENNALGEVRFYAGSSGATVRGNTFMTTQPIRVYYPNLSLSAVTGNTYAANSFIVMSGGTLNEAHTWDVVDGLSRYSLISNLTVSSGAVLTVASGVEVQTSSGATGILANGGLNATGASFTGGGSIQINGGGQANLRDCDFSACAVTCAAGSSGVLRCDKFASLSMNGATSVLAEYDDFSGGSLTGIGTAAQTIMMPNNWWGTTDPAQIAAKITDCHDQSDLPCVAFEPVLQERTCPRLYALCVGVTSPTPNGHYTVGDTVFVQVQFSEPVTVNTAGGSPTLTLETGTNDRDATYDPNCTTGDTVCFRYVVQPGDYSPDLDYTSATALSLNGATIKAAAAPYLDADPNLPLPGAQHSLAANKDIVVFSEFFDDFAYNDRTNPMFSCFGWHVRDHEAGWPGLCSQWAGAWDAGQVTLDNSMLHLRASTGGDCSNTLQSEVRTTDARFADGTYAARIQFTDAPHYTLGFPPSVQAFFLLNGHPACDPDYLEVDFEYLPNGTWTPPAGSPTLWMGWWRQKHDPNIPAPGCPDVHTTWNSVGSLDGDWHICTVQVANDGLRYYIDGNCVPEGGYSVACPDRPLRILFQHWFVEPLTSDPNQPFTMDVDWVYYAHGVPFEPSDISARVQELRGAGALRWDTLGDKLDANLNGLPDECEVPGDLDGDGDVDAADFLRFAPWLAGPGEPPGSAEADLDADGDADLADFARLQAFAH